MTVCTIHANHLWCLHVRLRHCSQSRRRDLLNIPIHTSTRSIFSTMLCSVAAVCLVVPRCADAQEVSGTLPDTPLGQRTGELLNAFNSGSLDSIIGFVSDSFIPKTIEQRGGDRAVATYWAGVYRERGPLSFHSIEHRTLGQRTAEIVWLYGDVSRAWIGVILRLEGVAPYRVTGHSVLRWVRPLLKPEMEFPEAIGEYLDSYLTRMADADIFSGAVLLARDGKIVFEGAYGFENRSTNRTMSLDSRFKLASVTKMFTGVAIAQLAEAGKLKFDDKMSKYIPEYPKHIGKKVTIHQLLTHQSGIELDDYPRYNRDAAKGRSVDDLLQTQLKYIKRLNLGNYDDFEPLGSYDYTNEGIDLLGVIVERASKETWPKYIADHIFAKAGMENTGTDTVDGDPGLVTPYSSLSTLGTSAAERRAVDGKRNLNPRWERLVNCEGHVLVHGGTAYEQAVV
ncbi:MAG TPA: class A beta-lactamase-related serine hydrolase [Candidatus Hydrogenedentes bacterium]|nr:class A beta-lactamase-related serine hydrolase [Candidatus Hydrogenedentota bacterium]